MAKEQRLCIIDGSVYLKRIPKTKKAKKNIGKIVGYGICPTCQRKILKNQIAIIAIDPSKSNIDTSGSFTPSEIYRTGQIAWTTKENFSLIFDTPIVPILGYAYCTEQTFNRMFSEYIPFYKRCT